MSQSRSVYAIQAAVVSAGLVLASAASAQQVCSDGEGCQVGNVTLGNVFFGLTGYGGLAWTAGGGGNAYSLLTDGTNTFVNAPNSSGSIFFRSANQGQDPTGSLMNLDGTGLLTVSRYINTGGLTATVQGITSTGGVYGVKGITTSNAGPGIWGTANLTGVHGQASAANGTGVFGETAGSTGAGVWGQATVSGGVGVAATAIDGNGLYVKETTGGTASGNAAIFASVPQTSDVALWITGAAYKPGAGMFKDTSDARVKRNVSDFSEGLSALEKVRPVSYQFNGLGETNDDGRVYVGVIAQELEQVLPAMVSRRKAKLHKTDDRATDIREVDPSEFTFLLINAVKDLSAETKALRAQVSRLAARDEALQSRLAQIERSALVSRAEATPVASDRP